MDAWARMFQEEADTLAFLLQEFMEEDMHTFNYPGFFTTWHASDKKYDASIAEVQQAWQELQSVPSYVERYAGDVRWLLVIPVDFVLHDEAHPFCDQANCLCHQDIQAKSRCVFRPAMDGLLTHEEALRILHGEQL